MAAAPARTEAVRLLRLLAILFVVGWLVHRFAFATVRIADDAMLPQLRRGDVVLVARWRRDRPPERGDVVAVRAGDGAAVRRVTGLPGERVALDAGSVRLNKRALPRLRVGDILLPMTDGGCPGGGVAGSGGCRHRRYRETLPDGRAYPVLGDGGTMPAQAVPPGHFGLLGDNRAVRGDGPVILPVDRRIGPATILIWSQDDRATWRRPRAWWRAIRWPRVGLRIA